MTVHIFRRGIQLWLFIFSDEEYSHGRSDFQTRTIALSIQIFRRGLHMGPCIWPIRLPGEKPSYTCSHKTMKTSIRPFAISDEEYQTRPLQFQTRNSHGPSKFCIRNTAVVWPFRFSEEDYMQLIIIALDQNIVILL